MQRAPLSLLSLVLVWPGALAVGSCDRDAPPPAAEEWLADEEAEDEPEPTRKVVSPLDSYGNLKGLGERVFGFERPHASREADRRSKVPVYYLMANEERMLRFFRSRGHVVIETATGWRFEHSDRTLEAAGEEDAKYKDARIYARQGPGAGWTLIFDDGKPIQTTKLPLMQLLEKTTRQEAPAPKDQAKAPSGDESAPDKGGGSTGAATLRKLERAALQRPINRKRARDVSARIYKHARKSNRRFLD